MLYSGIRGTLCITHKFLTCAGPMPLLESADYRQSELRLVLSIHRIALSFGKREGVPMLYAIQECPRILLSRQPVASSDISCGLFLETHASILLVCPDDIPLPLIVLLPMLTWHAVGMLIAQNRWTSPLKKDVAKKNIWFWLHAAGNAAGLAPVIAAIAIALK